MVGAEGHQRAVEEGVVIFEPVSLVHGEQRPRHRAQDLLVLQQDLIRGEDSIELELLVRVAPLILTDLGRGSGRDRSKFLSPK